MVKALQGSLLDDTQHIVAVVIARAHGTLYLANHSGSISITVERSIGLQGLPKFE